MASCRSKAFLSLGQIYIPVLGFNKASVKVTYATALSINSSPGNKGEFHCRCEGFRADSKPKRQAKLIT